MTNEFMLTPKMPGINGPHTFGYACGKAAFKDGKPCRIRHDRDFAAFLHKNKISLTASIRQAWTRGWDNAQIAADFAQRPTLIL